MGGHAFPHDVAAEFDQGAGLSTDPLLPLLGPATAIWWNDLARIRTPPKDW